MEEILGEVTKGFFRGIGYILAEIFFWTICYWVGWPICKVLTFGSYPKTTTTTYLDNTNHKSFGCAFVGLLTIIGAIAFYIANFVQT